MTDTSTETRTAFLAYIPPMPEWPTAGERFIDGVTTFRDRIYRLELGFRPLSLDLHVPDGAGPFPVAVYAHAGGFMLGSPVMGEWRELLAQGIAVASIRYRLRSEATHPAAVTDVVAAALWVREHADEYQLDAGRMLGMGSSAGAFLVNSAALRYGRDGEPYTPGAGNLFAGVASFYSPVDFLHLAEDATHGLVEEPGTPTASETLYLGYSPAERPEDAADVALTAGVRSDAPPFLLFHGMADTRVGVGQVRRLHAALVHAGVDVTVYELPDGTHGDPRFGESDAQSELTNFAGRVLGI